MSETKHTKPAGSKARFRREEPQPASNGLLSLIRTRRKETAVALILLLLAVATFDSGDDAEEVAANQSMENIEEILDGFAVDSEGTAMATSDTSAGTGNLTIPAPGDAAPTDPFAALSIPAESPLKLNSPSLHEDDSFTAFSNDPIRISPASSGQANSESNPFDANPKQASPFQDDAAASSSQAAPRVRLTGTIEAVN